MSTWDAYKKTMVEAPSLWTAAKDDDLPELERLLDEGMEIDARDHRGYSPLMLAAYAGNTRAFELLLRRGADVNTADYSANSVLMGAAFKGHLEMVRTLLSAGARLSDRNDAGLDARGFAGMFGQTAVVELLTTWESPERAAH